ncbi:MAG TPA: WbuC family cupin fold metalloprotein [Bryobacteraceae bacterium]|nr:WbuC family cupin fold metalloprotein [Bryobacteraceae bacterium]
MQRIQLVDSTLIASLIERARQSPRRRVNHNFHAGMDDNPHRFLNVMLEGTYVTPHRHQDPPKSESFLVLEGRVALFTFRPGGEVDAIQVLGGDPVGADLAPGVWHTIAVLTPYAVCFEVKPGPYSAANDKDFAPWAPREGDPAASAYLESLIAQVG